MKYYTLNFASTYGSCAYGTSSFEDSATCATTGAGGSSSSGGSAGGSSSNGIGGLLTNTGFDFILVATVVCVVAFVALVVRFTRKPAKNQQS